MKAWGALAVILCLDVSAQVREFRADEIAAMKQAGEAYGQCIIADSKKLAPANERPSDIVAAALHSCRALRGKVFDVIVEMNRRTTGFGRPDEAESTVKLMEESAKNAAIRAIIESRNPKLK